MTRRRRLIRYCATRAQVEIVLERFTPCQHFQGLHAIGPRWTLHGSHVGMWVLYGRHTCIWSCWQGCCVALWPLLIVGILLAKFDCLLACFGSCYASVWFIVVIVKSKHLAHRKTSKEWDLAHAYFFHPSVNLYASLIASFILVPKFL